MKNTFVVSCPIDTYSGYGARARDFIKSLIELDKYDVKILSQRWGNTTRGFIENNKEEWGFLEKLIIPGLQEKPDYWCMITVPNEFQSVGKYNIGLTAGIETTNCDIEWVRGCNRMDLILTSSEHSKSTFINSQFQNSEKKDDIVKLEKPIEVLFEGTNLNVYKTIKKFENKDLYNQLNSISEDFSYLVVGHWMQGSFGHDRKNIAFTIKSFYETFKDKENPPALILKICKVNASIGDKEEIQRKIDDIRDSIEGKNIPSVYLLHGEFTDKEMNELYNHPKVKAMVSFTKGEGFGRPLLEFATVGKPIIASGWSGQIDFLHREYNLLVGGDLKNVHKSAAQKEMILEESKWFTPNDQEVAKAYRESFKHYKKYEQLAKSQRKVVRDNFTYEHMVTKLGEVLNKSIPEFPTEVKLTLPKLNLPKLEKA